MYYIYNTANTLYLRYHRGTHYGSYWAKKPRIYTTKGAMKLSIWPLLLEHQWNLLSESEREQRIQSCLKTGYQPREEEWRRKAAETRAMREYWREIKDRPIEDLLPPYLELRAVEL